MTTKVVLDVRSIGTTGEAPLKISVSKHGKTAYYPLNIKVLPINWDAKSQRIIGMSNAVVLNSYITSQKAKFDSVIMRLVVEDSLGGMSAREIKDKVASILSPKEEDTTLFLPYFKKFADSRKKPNTVRIYNQTYNKLLDFTNRQLHFDDITKKWLEEFDSYLYNERNNDINTIAIDMRNIRAVVNDAIDNNITSTYSFRKKYRIKKKETRKRSLSVERLRELFNYQVEPFMQKYLDTFKLTFFLIGINTIDLCALERIEEGRIVYDRSKTGRLYNIKVEPEALELLNRYKGKAHLFGLAEKSKDYFSFLTNLDKYLKQIGPLELVPNPNKQKCKTARSFLKRRTSAFPGLSIYWARHTWATIASSLDIPRETISAALGHGYGNQTTSIYINFDLTKIDEANRKVIDYVLYNKV